MVKGSSIRHTGEFSIMRDKIKCIRCSYKDSVKNLDHAVLEIIDKFYNDENESDLAILYIYAKRKSDDMEALYKWSYIDDEMKDISPEDLIYLAFTKGKDLSNKS